MEESSKKEVIEFSRHIFDSFPFGAQTPVTLLTPEQVSIAYRNSVWCNVSHGGHGDRNRHISFVCRSEKDGYFVRFDLTLPAGRSIMSYHSDGDPPPYRLPLRGEMVVPVEHRSYTWSGSMAERLLEAEPAQTRPVPETGGTNRVAENGLPVAIPRGAVVTRIDPTAGTITVEEAVTGTRTRDRGRDRVEGFYMINPFSYSSYHVENRPEGIANQRNTASVRRNRGDR